MNAIAEVVVFPGQGSQRVGMGGELFDRYTDLVAEADEILGYRVRTLCLEDADDCLGRTEYTQPALFVVNALHYLAHLEDAPRPSLVLGHSLGEYNALLAAGVFDFATGLRLVQARAAAMSKVEDGGMSAVIGLSEEVIAYVLGRERITGVDVANLNTPRQVVLSGPLDELGACARPLTAAGAKMVRPLAVSGPFHSRYMARARRELAEVFAATTFGAPTIPVIANVTGRPYESDTVAELLSMQIDNPVRWGQSCYRLLAAPDTTVTEMYSNNLTRMFAQMRRYFDAMES
ncbi:ACP S-malonyltransferase [Nocardia arizonensis]|uniref:ACP S-malonyltransferase n=1 Tax=Nocardia arizonensis TaxID=1141647 RepID=UPI000AE0D460|nr:ACP S-malonyltransferase [Nocardia arizonensis]